MITVYTLENCPQCQATKRSFDKLGFPYQEVSLTDSEALRQVKGWGMAQAPVIDVAFDGFTDRWSRFRPDRIQQLTEHVTREAFTNPLVVGLQNQGAFEQTNDDVSLEARQEWVTLMKSSLHHDDGPDTLRLWDDVLGQTMKDQSVALSANTVAILNVSLSHPVTRDHRVIGYAVGASTSPLGEIDLQRALTPDPGQRSNLVKLNKVTTLLEGQARQSHQADPEALATVGYLHWWQGDTASSREFVELAREIQPDHRLANLVNIACDMNIPSPLMHQLPTPLHRHEAELTDKLSHLGPGEIAITDKRQYRQLASELLAVRRELASPTLRPSAGASSRTR